MSHPKRIGLVRLPLTRKHPAIFWNHPPYVTEVWSTGCHVDMDAANVRSDEDWEDIKSEIIKSITEQDKHGS